VFASYAIDNLEMVTRFRIVVMKCWFVDGHVTFSLTVLEPSTLGFCVLLYNQSFHACFFCVVDI